MNVFLDFEASSLADRSYPIEVAWVVEDGRSESHLIAPAPNWTDWAPVAERIHGIARDTSVSEGTAHDLVAARMVETLSGHALLASAPSWDGKWMSAMLRAAGLPRHALRLQDTDGALRDTALAILRDVVPADGLAVVVHDLVAHAGATKGTIRNTAPLPTRPRSSKSGRGCATKRWPTPPPWRAREASRHSGAPCRSPQIVRRQRARCRAYP